MKIKKSHENEDLKIDHYAEIGSPTLVTRERQQFESKSTTIGGSKGNIWSGFEEADQSQTDKTCQKWNFSQTFFSAFFASCHLSPWLVPGLLLINFLPTSLSKSTKSFQARFVAYSLFSPSPTLLWCQHISLPNNIQNLHIVWSRGCWGIWSLRNTTIMVLGLFIILIRYWKFGSIKRINS